MKSLLSRTGSIQAHAPASPGGSPKYSFPRNDSFSSLFYSERRTVTSPRISLHLEINSRDRETPLRRSFSETDIFRSDVENKRLPGARSFSFPARILEEEQEEEELSDLNNAGMWPESGIPLAEIGFSSGGGGSWKRKNSTGGDDGGDDGGLSKIGDYYKEMLKSNPTDFLLLRNYGKFLHEVEGDMERAEEYYGRAILESPGDGEVLSLYGKLIWDKQRDNHRAQSYFDRAVSAAPHDCMVMGSYAHFMWEAEEDEDEDEEIENKALKSPPAMAAVI